MGRIYWRQVLELWAGHECTVNRVGNVWRDQTRLTGHHDRIEDLTAFARLGIRKIRYPVLWERVAPHSPDIMDWTWTDKRLDRIGRLGLHPIVGLLHHGSGPRYTSLIAEDFPAAFERYAKAVAEHYPWVDDWTPINEPLTTARFSALYGVWYPHARDRRSFWLALLNQIDGIRLAMKAIRRVNPKARLVQTEDLGHTYATPPLASVALHYNRRRWLSWDLLAGKLSPDHPMWAELEELGFADRARAIFDDPCPPDVIGVNHYVTSDRFLDHRLEAYSFPPHAEGYHDITAARVLDPAPDGLAAALRQAWDRYRLPLAVTEAHLGCTREEQMRWMQEIWDTAVRLRQEGADIRAVTAWALLGSVDWNSLITVEAGHYEPGPFDIRGGQPRETAVAKLLRGLGGARGEPAGSRTHPAMAGRGWWRRDIRLEHPPYPSSETMRVEQQEQSSRPILVAGATGTLGRAFAAACHMRGLDHLLTDRTMLRIDDPAHVADALDSHQPWAVINAAGWVRVDEAERNAAECLRANADGAAILAAACAERGIHYTMFSSDLVFDGKQEGGYVERDAPRPLSVYGRSKAEAEERTMRAHGGALVVRTAAFFSPHDAYNFAVHVEKHLRSGTAVSAADGYFVTPTFVPDLVNACLDLIVDDETGIWHLTSQEPLSWFQFGARVADALNLDPALVRPAQPRDLGWRARRPPFAALFSAKGRILPGFEDALARHAKRRDSLLRQQPRSSLAATE